MSGGPIAPKAPRIRNAPNRIPTTVSDSSTAALTAYINRITELCPHLPPSVPEGTPDDSPGTVDGKIYRVVHHTHSLVGWTYSSVMIVVTLKVASIMSACGPYGMILFAKYLRTIKWATDGIPLTTAALKLSEVAKRDGGTLLHAVITPVYQLAHHLPPPPHPVRSVQPGKLCLTMRMALCSRDQNIYQTRNGTVTIEDEDEDEFPASIPPPPKSFVAQSPNRASSVQRAAPSKPRTNSSDQKKSHVTPPPPGSDPTATGDDGLLLDIDVAEITVSETLDTHRRSQEFFHPATPMVGSGGLYLALQQMSRNGSKLRLRADAEVKRLHQQTLEPHLREKPERVIPYSMSFGARLLSNGSSLLTRDNEAFHEQMDKFAGLVCMKLFLASRGLNNAHHGVRLGQALFKIIKRLNLEGRVTCDNATNNGTMLVELARLLLAATNRVWDPIEHRINKSPHFNPHDPNAHVPTTETLPGSTRDEIGLVRAIAVKERSSSKRKELFKTIQTRSQADPAVIAKQMVLDMKVRWSSTFAMLKRGYQLRKASSRFTRGKQICFRNLSRSSRLYGWKKRNGNAWNCLFTYSRVRRRHSMLSPLICGQHFTSQSRPWSSYIRRGVKRATTAKYARFWSALNEALEKVNEYYEKTSTSNVYTFAMVLDPRKKLAYFTKNWDKELQAAALANMEETFQQRYLELHANKAAQTPALFSQQSQAPDKSGLRELTPDGDEDEPKLAEAHLDPTKPWRDEFQSYLDARESVPEGMTTIEWWGVCFHFKWLLRTIIIGTLSGIVGPRLPGYHGVISIFRTRLFPLAGITISKRRNRLKGDLVEALQVLKCLMCHEEEWEMGARVRIRLKIRWVGIASWTMLWIITRRMPRPKPKPGRARPSPRAWLGPQEIEAQALPGRAQAPAFRPSRALQNTTYGTPPSLDSHNIHLMIPAQAKKDRCAALYDCIRAHIVALCACKTGSKVIWLLYTHPIQFILNPPLKRLLRRADARLLRVLTYIR
ncbi:hypothetical protein B0H14DRAFT_3557446 [Mycena olivaceomarginata]|nr:hypothetical protein B0H14DRAFT_3557446 [Mycena olivaceomarginata]